MIHVDKAKFVFCFGKKICNLIISFALLNYVINIWNASEGLFYLQYVNCILIDLAILFEYYVL